MFLHDSLQLTKFLTNVHVIGCYIFYLGADKYFQLTTSVCSLFITRVLPVLLSDWKLLKTFLFWRWESLTGLSEIFVTYASKITVNSRCLELWRDRRKCSRYLEFEILRNGFKTKIFIWNKYQVIFTSPVILYLQPYFHITNAIPWIINKIIIRIIVTT